MPFTNPQPSDFKNFFFRDFPYGTDVENNVLDQDILNAMSMTNGEINPKQWDDQTTYNNAYFYLTAHFLQTNLNAASQGVNSQGEFLQTSKSAGGVSVGFAIPDQIQRNPRWMELCTTKYGLRYVMLLYPRSVGQVITVRGRTKP